MKKAIGLILLFLFISIQEGYAQKNELLHYISFLENQKTDPVEYVFDLFEKYDVVILGERDHRDTAQYVLIEKIISDPRFIKDVGNVFTEVGASNRSEWANSVLQKKYESWSEFEDSLRVLYRELDTEILWQKTNYWICLSSIHNLNNKLPDKQKINIHFLDMAYDWSKCYTREQRKLDYGVYNSGKRESVMGNNFIQSFEKILADKKQSRKKALVILNPFHSYQKMTPLSATGFIIEKYQQRVANVMINSCNFMRSGKDKLLYDGKWDAAFRYLDNPSVGFDFEGSPFGEDLFDQWDELSTFKNKEIYTGFIFYKPIEDWVLSMGVTGIIDDSFREEFLRRKHLDEQMDDYSDGFVIKAFNEKRTGSWYESTFPKDTIDYYIDYWLK